MKVIKNTSASSEFHVGDRVSLSFGSGILFTIQSIRMCADPPSCSQYIAKKCSGNMLRDMNSLDWHDIREDFKLVGRGEENDNV